MRSPEGPVPVAIAGDDHACRVLATRLLDLILLERAAGAWPERDELDQLRAWCGFQHKPGAPESERFFDHHHLTDELKRLKSSSGVALKTFNRIGDEPAGEAALFLKLYQLFALREPPVSAIVVIWDADSNPNKRQHAQRALDHIRTQQRRTGEGPVMVVGVPVPEAEAWFIRALQDVPDERLARAMEVLSFDPIRQPERLTSVDRHPHDAKRVLHFLLYDAKDLESMRHGTALSPQEYEELASTWTLADLATMSQAEACGLADFLRDLRERVAPVLLPGPTH